MTTKKQLEHALKKLDMLTESVNQMTNSKQTVRQSDNKTIIYPMVKREPLE